ncbi:nad-dependent epimerase/dehydratase [Heliomicrobium modesticaldum Ice1]|uniref:Nad-dependent epimerase/dehydratase n=1 Tax=Heliobacterium modesticaldum (strain ATCC 51547 / Ice1) TaxID=498761 RepID=B0THE7_HELMI|nr:SDR family oxidoreductase [Heliomicrobium modesticaldum]ABZ83385.1 nad-dependent epimerase/dehydratase [Heliomicrobium modesticaldum Ice1]
MKLLVTGGAGFIGSHVVERCIARGDEVLVVDDLSTGKRENIPEKAAFFHLDVADDEIKGVIAREAPEAIIHLAAQVDVQVSLRDPLHDARTNILGTLNLLEACRQSGVKRMIVASSAAVYGDPLRLPVDEEHRLAPANPYGISKHTPEHYLQLYRELYGITGVALRFANVYGPRQDAAGEGGVVAIFTERLLRGIAPVIYGDGEQTRDFVYVDDVVDAMLLVLEAETEQLRHSVYNVSTGRGTSVKALFALIRERVGVDLAAQMAPARPGDILHSYLDNRRLKDAVGWTPKTALPQGLDQTVARWSRSWQ